MNWSVWITVWLSLLLDLLWANPLVSLDELIEEFNVDYEKLKRRVTCLPDSRFYTPTNVQPVCVATAMGCFFEEFKNVAQNECEDPTKIMRFTTELLEHIHRQVKKDIGQNGADGCACEKWSTAPYGDFVASMKDLLEQITSSQAGFGAL